MYVFVAGSTTICLQYFVQRSPEKMYCLALSLRMYEGVPRRLTKRRKASRNLSVVAPSQSSRCIALVVRQEKMTPYILVSSLLEGSSLMAWNGPKKSIPVLVNGACFIRRHSGNGGSSGSFNGLAWNLKHS